MTKAQAKQTKRKVEVKISPEVCDPTFVGTGSTDIPFNNQLTPSKKNAKHKISCLAFSINYG
jgi:hypothetical protein